MHMQSPKLERLPLLLVLHRAVYPPCRVINGASEARANREQSADQAADQVLPRSAGDDGVVRTRHTGAVVSTQHDAPARQQPPNTAHAAAWVTSLYFLFLAAMQNAAQGDQAPAPPLLSTAFLSG
jgi:hypothetical protein